MSRAATNIFVVDDDESVRKSLWRLLRSAGFEVRTFASAAEFLAVAPTCGAGVLVLDLRMPLMNGLELQRHLRADGNRIPIIVITAHDGDDARADAMAAGAVGFIRKPFEDETLLSLIDAALAGGGLPGA